MKDLIFFFSTLGVFNGFLLSSYLLIFSKQKSLSKYLLGALILALSLRIGKSILLYFNPDLPKIYLQIGLSACLFIGPLLFLYLKSAIKQTNYLSKQEKGLLIFLGISAIILGIIRPYHNYPEFWNLYVVKSIYLIWFIGLCASSYILLPKLQKQYILNDKLSALEQWLLVIFIGNLIIASAFFLAIFGNSMAYYITGPLVFSFFLYLLAFGYFNKQWFNIEASLKKYSNKKIPQEEATLLIANLNELMAKKKVYKNPQLKIKDLAMQLNVSSHHLSQLLNDNLGKSYKSFINEYRIHSACNLLKTSHHLSLEGIGYEVGFRSKSTFFTTFKKVMAQTPSQFQASVRKETS